VRMAYVSVWSGTCIVAWCDFCGRIRQCILRVHVLCVWFVHSGGLSVDPMFDVLCFVCFCCCLVLVLFLLLFCVFCVSEIGMSLLWLSW
jgi:hypothetical protein